MNTITVILKDTFDGYPDPLIYKVDVKDAQDHDEVLAAVTKARRYDLDLADEEPCELEIYFAFDGDLIAVSDWRE